MNEEQEIIVRPKTNCLFMKLTAVACDDYITKDGKNFTCCKKCGWNPEVADRRLAKIRRRA